MKTLKLGKDMIVIDSPEGTRHQDTRPKNKEWIKLEHSLVYHLISNDGRTAKCDSLIRIHSIQSVTHTQPKNNVCVVCLRVHKSER